MSQPLPREPQQRKSKRRRIALAVLAAAALLLTCGLLLPCVQQVRDGEAWVYTASHMRQCALAMHNYEFTYGHLPPAAAKDAQGHPLYSWRVLILPFIEQDDLYKQFHLDEPWDSRHNLTLLNKMPKTYDRPFGGRDGPGMTRLQVPVGPGSVFERDGLDLDQIPNGTERTILIVESDTPVPWTMPADFTYDSEQSLPGFTMQTKGVRFLGREFWRERGFVLCFADAHTEFNHADSPESTIRARMRRASLEN